MVQSELHGHRRIHARHHFLEWDGSFLVGQRIGRNHQQAFRDCLFRADSKLPQIFIKWTEYQQTLQVCLLLRDLLFGHRSFFSWQQIRKKGKFIYSWYDISQKNVIFGNYSQSSEHSSSLSLPELEEGDWQKASTLSSKKKIDVYGVYFFNVIDVKYIIKRRNQYFTHIWGHFMWSRLMLSAIYCHKISTVSFT